jgi:hypothetical protein
VLDPATNPVANPYTGEKPAPPEVLALAVHVSPLNSHGLEDIEQSGIIVEGYVFVGGTFP